MNPRNKDTCLQLIEKKHLNNLYYFYKDWWKDPKNHHINLAKYQKCREFKNQHIFAIYLEQDLHVN